MPTEHNNHPPPECHCPADRWLPGCHATRHYRDMWILHGPGWSPAQFRAQAQLGLVTFIDPEPPAKSRRK